MKLVGAISTAVLSLLLGLAAPAYAQQEQRGEKQNHPDQQQSKQEQAKPEQQHAQQQRQPAQKQEPQPHAQQQQRQDRNNKQRAQQQRAQRAAWQQHRSQRWDSDHRNWQQRGGYNGYRIPDERFRGYFGQDHGFRIYGLPFLVVGGYPRFQYNGYWFSMVDPWPGYWANDWYDTDDVYVTYVDNGYYLFDRRYPNVGIAISISM